MLLQVIQKLKNDDNIFLRLADDRGWVFQFHPKARYDLMLKVPGDYLEEESTYSYPEHFIDDLNIFTGPSFDSEVMEGQAIKPGSVFQISGIWMAVSSEQETEYPMAFAKLVKSHGWVTLSDVDTGEIILHKTSSSR